jgi:N-acetylglucosaminyldiphosphoundecaprenol N-acetyl-beta-D-mannosaminyltransferase
LYGSAPRVTDLLAQKLPVGYPGLQIVGAESPPFRTLTPEEHADVVRRINESGARIVFIGLGCPNRNHFAADHAVRIQAAKAAFEFHTDTKPTAPQWMQRHGLESFYRLLSEPRRLWSGYLHTDSVFLAKWLASSFSRIAEESDSLQTE